MMGLEFVEREPTPDKSNETGIHHHLVGPSLPDTATLLDERIDPYYLHRALGPARGTPSPHKDIFDTMDICSYGPYPWICPKTTTRTT